MAALPRTGDAIEGRLQQAFGAHVKSEGPLAPGGAGFRLRGIDLSEPLQPDQVDALLDALGHYRIMTLADQDLAAFSAAHFERFANHWARRCRIRATSSASATRGITNPNCCRHGSAPLHA